MKTSESKISSLITKDFIAISENETVGNAVAFLKNQKAGFQSKSAYIYVVNDRKKLTGVLQTRDLLLEDPVKEIYTVMKESITSISEHAALDKVIDLFQSNLFLAVPVVDSENELIGIISRKNLKSQLSGENLKRLERVRTVESEEVEGSNVIEMAFKRLPWLLISVTSGLVCSYILGIFIGKIESIVALILFVPIILGLAGNIGTQSARVTSRNLEAGKISINQLVSMLWKEILIGSIIAIFAFLLTAAIALLWKRFPIEGIALGASILVVSAASGLLGIVLPVTFKTLRIRSNFASGLFILVICDTLALVLYFLISLSLVSPTLVIT